jgi:enoyl-CoA hydratase
MGFEFVRMKVKLSTTYGVMNMSDSSWIKRIDHDGGVVELSLNRGPVNALTPDALFGLRDCINGLSEDANVGAIVLSSPLKVLSAGLNLKEARGFDDDQQDAIVCGLNEGFLALYACPKPVICAINGAAIAGGLFFVLTADHRIAAPKAQFGLAEVRVGVDFPVGPLEIAKAALSSNDARRLMLRGQPVDAQTAQSMGLVDLIVDAEDVLPQALKDATEFACIPAKAYASIKNQLRGDVIARIRAAPPSTAQWFTEETTGAMSKMLGEH